MFNVGSYNNEEEAIQAGLDDTYLRPSTGDVFKANLSDGFDMSTTGVAWNWANEKYLNTQGKPMTQDEWKGSPFYREGIQFEDGWSSYRAEHMAQVFDERQVDKKIMEKQSGFFQGAVGLAGQFAGAVTDPTNFIPFAGGASKATSLGAKLAKGATEGAIGNLAVSAVARPYWETKGDEEAGFTDYAMDTVIGGLFGGGMAGLGHGYRKWREKPISQKTQSTINEASDSVVTALDNGGIEELDYSLLDNAFNETSTIDAQIRSERVKTIELEVARITGDEAYAKNAALTIDSFAETMSEELGMTPDDFMKEFGFEVQASEMVGKKNDPRFLKRPIGEAEIEVSKMIDSEVQNLMSEIESAQAGEKLFIDGEFKGATKSTFPQWFRDAGFKSKKEFLDAAKNKNSSKYDVIRELAEDRLKASGDPEYVTYTGFGLDDIPTNEMGEPLFKKTQTNEVRGAYTPSDASINGQRVPDFIHLMESADKSTFLHESAHWMLETTKRIIDSGRASDRIKADFETITKWANEQKKLSDNPNVQVHEAFAQGYEAYLREGKAPTKELQGAFERFSQWLREVYARVTDLDVKLNDDIRGVYDRLFQNDAQKMRELEMELGPKKTSFNLEAPAKTEQDFSFDSLIESKKDLFNEGEAEELASIINPMSEEKKFLENVKAFFQGVKNAEDAANDLEVSGDKFNKLIKEFEEKLRAENGDGVDPLDQIDDELRKLDEKLIKEKKKAYLSLVARERAIGQIDEMLKEFDANGAEVLDLTGVLKGQNVRRKANVEDAILAMIEGNNSLRGIKDAGNSIASNTQGTYNAMTGELHKGLKRLSEEFKVDLPKYYGDSLKSDSRPVYGNFKFHELVYLEMASLKADGTFKDISGIPLEARNTVEFRQARELAKILADTSNKYREIANNLGAEIGHYEGWTPRSHDIDKIAGKRDSWKSFVVQHIDMKKTFGFDIKGSDLEKALDIMYAELTTGVRNNFDVDSMVKNLPKNLAKKISESREIHFKDAMGEFLYAKEFGSTTNIVEAVNNHFGSRAREIALLEKLGPNPESTLRKVVQKYREDLKLKDTDEARNIIKNLDEQSLINRSSSIGSALMYAMGETSENTNLRKYGAIIRAWNSLTMLGSSTLSQVADFSHAFNERRMLEGENTLTAWTGVIKDYVTKNKDGAEIANYMGVMIDGMLSDGMNRFDVANDFKTNIDGLNNTLFKIIGVEWHTRKMKKGAMTMYAKELADNLDRSWDEIHPQMRERLVEYGGFDKNKWEFIKKLERMEFGDNKLVTADAIDELSLKDFEEFIPSEFRGEAPFDVAGNPESLAAWEANKLFELQKAKTSLSNSFRSYFIESIKNNVLEPDARTRRLMFGRHKAGTTSGEAVRLATQFKTFTALYMDRSLGGKRYQIDASDSFGKYQFIAGQIILGYTAMTLKDLAKGHEPKDPTLPQSWAQAAFQSGGLGIFGDFIQGSMGRNSASLLETLAGPTASRAGAFSHLILAKAAPELYRAAQGEKTDFEGLASDFIDQGKQMIPFNNVFYTRAIADYLIWHNIKETLEPGSIRRNERRLKKEFNQKYIVSPREFQWMN